MLLDFVPLARAARKLDRPFYNMESNWPNGLYAAVGRRIQTPFMDMTYRPTRGPQFNKGEPPPNVPYVRGFDT
jgi:hypothetical protein